MLLERQAAQYLISNQKTLSIAESCSGGLLSHRLTNISGSSQFLQGAIIAYSNTSKIKLLKVSAKKIKNFGAVSETVALSMAQNVREIFDTDFGLSITGIAGPTGATKGKPVGLTFVALAAKNNSICLKCHFKGNRQQVKSKAVNQALKLLQKFFN